MKNENTKEIENQIANITDTRANAILLDSLQNQLNHERISNSYLAKISTVLEPIFKPLGYDWHIISALITGTVAKELIVSTLSIVMPTRGSIAQILSLQQQQVYCFCITLLSMYSYFVIYQKRNWILVVVCICGYLYYTYSLWCGFTS